MSEEYLHNWNGKVDHYRTLSLDGNAMSVTFECLTCYLSADGEDFHELDAQDCRDPFARKL